PGVGTISAPVALGIVPQETPVAAVTVHPALAFTRVGAGVALTAGVQDASGRPLQGRYISYESSNHLVATVDANGLVRPVGAGEATITVRSEGMSATSIISVSSDQFHHLFASDGVGLTSMDLRLGSAPGRFWENWPGSRALDPSASPDGMWIAYTIENTIPSDSGSVSLGRMVALLNLMNMTYQVIPDTGPADQPVWSPAGDRIAFRAKVGDRTHIFTVRPDGTGLQNLTADLPPESSAQDPAWSPDGSRIVFAVQSDPGFWGLMIMNSDGSGKRNLTSGAVDIQPVWLGDVVVFARRDPQGTATDIWRISVSGVGPFMPLTATGTAHSPTLSPDHGWIAYVEGAEQGAGTLMAMRPFGEDARPLYTPAPGERGVLTPVWVMRR
ncbi:MAG TPA: Ig-like domain-containing protein, partial [Longimicrobiales bacterium]|nr:Ig-like domain-containing protein [Longimicrobiales bacterium]